MKELKFWRRLFAFISYSGLKQQGQASREALTANTNDAQAHHRLGVALAAQGKGEAAIEELRTALGLDAGDVEARYLLANLLTLNEQYNQAITEFREVLRAVPDNAQVHLELGSALYKANRRSEARAA